MSQRANQFRGKGKPPMESTEAEEAEKSIEKGTAPSFVKGRGNPNKKRKFGKKQEETKERKTDAIVKKVDRSKQSSAPTPKDAPWNIVTAGAWSREVYLRYYNPNFARYFDMVDQTYVQLQKATDFSRNIPRSMYFMYCMWAVWARIIQLSKDLARPIPNADHLIDMFKPNEFALPRPLYDILSWLGKIKTSSDIELRPSLDVYPASMAEHDVPLGTFGQIDEMNHYWYMMLPAPAVFARWMEVENAMGQPGAPGWAVNVWDLPEDIRPADLHEELAAEEIPDPNFNRRPFNHPTQNLIGWKPAEPFTPYTRTAFRGAFRPDLTFITDGADGYLFNANVKGRIQSCLLGIKAQGSYDIELRIPQNVDGAQMQVPWTALMTQTPVAHYTAHPYPSLYNQGDCYARSFDASIPDYDLKTATASAYRMIPAQLPVARNSWSIYLFDNYLNVLQDWIDTHLNGFQPPVGDLDEDNVDFLNNPLFRGNSVVVRGVLEAIASQYHHA